MLTALTYEPVWPGISEVVTILCKTFLPGAQEPAIQKIKVVF
jgi:hypothetical protein